MSRALLLKGLSSGYLNQGATLIYGIVSLPLLLNHFGSELYGIWVLVFGLATYLSSLSFGVPNTLIAMVAKTKGLREKYVILWRCITLLSILVCLCLLFLGVSLLFGVGWVQAVLGNVSSQYASLSVQVFLILLVFTLIKMPLGLFMYFFSGMNLVYITQNYTALGFLLNLLVVGLTVLCGWDIVRFTIVLMAAQLLLSVAAFLHAWYRFRHLRCHPPEGSVKTWQVMKSSFAYFQLGISATLVWSTDNLVISHFLTAAEITPYAIAFKMFSYLFLCFAMVNTILTPMYGNAYASGDWGKINHIYRMVVSILPALAGALWVFFIFFGRELIALWTQNDQAFGGFGLLIALGFSGYLSTFVSIYSALVQGFNIANKTLLAVWLEAIANPILTILFALWLGLAGVALGNAIATLVVMFWLLPRVVQQYTGEKLPISYFKMVKPFLLLVCPAVVASAILIFQLGFIAKTGAFVLLMGLYGVGYWFCFDRETRDGMRNWKTIRTTLHV